MQYSVQCIVQYIVQCIVQYIVQYIVQCIVQYIVQCIVESVTARQLPPRASIRVNIASGGTSSLPGEIGPRLDANGEERTECEDCFLKNKMW